MQTSGCKKNFKNEYCCFCSPLEFSFSTWYNGFEFMARCLVVIDSMNASSFALVVVLLVVAMLVVVIVGARSYVFTRPLWLHCPCAPRQDLPISSVVALTEFESNHVCCISLTERRPSTPYDDNGSLLLCVTLKPHSGKCIVGATNHTNKTLARTTYIFDLCFQGPYRSKPPVISQRKPQHSNTTRQHNTTLHYTTLHYTTLHSTAQQSTAQHDTTHRSTAQQDPTPHKNTAQHSTAQHSTTHHTSIRHTTYRNTTHNNTTQHNTIQHNTRPYDTTQHNTTQHNTTQHNTTQHNTTQHNTTLLTTAHRNTTTPHNKTQHSTAQYYGTQHNTTRRITTQHKRYDISRNIT